MKQVFALFLILVPSFIFAQKDIAKQHIEALASPKMYGRGYVNNGIGIAADYIDSCFSSYKLQQFSKLTGYRQKVTYSVNTFPDNIKLTINDSIMTPGVDFIVEPFSKKIRKTSSYIYTSKIRMSNGKVIFNEGNNNILLLDERKSDTNSELIKNVNDYINYICSHKSNVSAIIELSNNKLNWSVSDFEGTIPYIQVNSKKFTQNSNSNISLIIDQKFIKKYKTYNICGYIPGIQNPDSMIVLTAHYDHLGMMGNKTMFPGANDNASGVSMLLNLAEYFSKHPQKYSIVFVALTGEEIGLKGSQAFVENSPFPLSKITFFINFDLAGTGNEGIQIVNSSVFKKETARLDSINSKYNFLPQIKKRGEACNSDHCPFYKKGVPSFFIYTLGGIQAYHDIYDKSETLPLTKFNEYFELMKIYIESF